MKASEEYRVEPGTLALCLAYRRHIWPVAMSSLGFIYGQTADVGNWINRIADRNMDWARISDDSGEYLRNIMQLHDA